MTTSQIYLQKSNGQYYINPALIEGGNLGLSEVLTNSNDANNLSIVNISQLITSLKIGSQYLKYYPEYTFNTTSDVIPPIVGNTSDGVGLTFIDGGPTSGSFVDYTLTLNEQINASSSVGDILYYCNDGSIIRLDTNTNVESVVATAIGGGFSAIIAFEPPGSTYTMLIFGGSFSSYLVGAITIDSQSLIGLVYVKSDNTYIPQNIRGIVNKVGGFDSSVLNIGKMNLIGYAPTPAPTKPIYSFYVSGFFINASGKQLPNQSCFCLTVADFDTTTNLGYSDAVDFSIRMDPLNPQSTITSLQTFLGGIRASSFDGSDLIIGGNFQNVSVGGLNYNCSVANIISTTWVSYSTGTGGITVVADTLAGPNTFGIIGDCVSLEMISLPTNTIIAGLNGINTVNGVPSVNNIMYIQTGNWTDVPIASVVATPTMSSIDILDTGIFVFSSSGSEFLTYTWDLSTPAVNAVVLSTIIPQSPFYCSSLSVINKDKFYSTYFIVGVGGFYGMQSYNFNSDNHFVVSSVAGDIFVFPPGTYGSGVEAATVKTNTFSSNTDYAVITFISDGNKGEWVMRNCNNTLLIDI